MQVWISSDMYLERTIRRYEIDSYINMRVHIQMAESRVVSMEIRRYFRKMVMVRDKEKTI